MIWDKLTSQQLYEALAAAVSLGDPVPSIEVCEKLRDLTPWPPSLTPRRQLVPSPDARKHALGLLGSLDELRVFWSSAVLHERSPMDSIGEAVSRRKYIFEDINKMEASIQLALRWTDTINIGPDEHWHGAALKLQQFFDAAKKQTHAPKPYGLSRDGPTIRFVSRCLRDLGWEYTSDASLLTELKRERKRGTTRG